MKIHLIQKKLAMVLMISMVFSLLLIPSPGKATDIEVDVASLLPTADAAIAMDTTNAAIANTNFDTKTSSSNNLEYSAPNGSGPISSVRANHGHSA